LTSHVGSARKKVGRTGFAHLFEHLLFFRIRKFGKGGLDKMSARIGVKELMVLQADRTNYFQTVPKDALEKNDLGQKTKWDISIQCEPVWLKKNKSLKQEKDRATITDRGHNFFQ
jgi:zinc protease